MKRISLIALAILCIAVVSCASSKDVDTTDTAMASNSAYTSPSDTTSGTDQATMDASVSSSTTVVDTSANLTTGGTSTTTTTTTTTSSTDPMTSSTSVTTDDDDDTTESRQRMRKD